MIFWLVVIVLVAIFSLWLLKTLFSVAIKVLIVVLIALVLFSVFARGAETKVFEGYIFSSQSITVDSKPFIVTFEENTNNQIMLNYNRNYFFVPFRECRTLLNLKFCYDDVIFDTDQKKDKVYLRVFTVAPDITITRTINTSSLKIGDEAEITVSVANGVGIPAENFTFVDSFSPDEFQITSVSWCSNTSSSVYHNLDC